MRREKRKQREAIERIKLGVQTQEELERQNEIPDVKKQLNGKHSVYTDEGDAAHLGHDHGKHIIGLLAQAFGSLRGERHRVPKSLLRHATPTLSQPSSRGVSPCRPDCGRLSTSSCLYLTC